MSMIYSRKPVSAPMAAFIILLGSLPGMAALSPDAMNAWFCDDSKPVLSVSSAAAAAPAAGGAPADSGEDVFSPLKPEGTRRVFVLGRSVGGLPGPAEKNPISAVLEDIFPDSSLELINCVPRDYGKQKISDVFEKVLAYDPDLVVVMGGNEAPGPGPRFSSTFGDYSGLSPEDAEAKDALSGHEGDLRAMAGQARDKGVPVVFCTQPANMCNYAPSGELPFDQVWLLKGMALLEKKDLAGALKLFELNLKEHPGEPFSLFYAGRALDGLGNAKDAAAYYSAAIKYDPAQDKCPAERNEMLRRAAAEEGACVADLDRAFPGIVAADSRWSREYGVFVSSVIGRAVRDCASAAGSSAGAATGAPKGRGENSAEDFRAILSYAVSDLSMGAFCDALPGERMVSMLERLYSMNSARLESLLFSPAELKKALRGGFPGDALSKGLPAWRPGLLYNAAEMFRRNGNAALARRCIDEALRLKADCPAFNFTRWRIRRAAGEAAGAKKDLMKAAAGPRTRASLAYLAAALDLAPGPLPAVAAQGTPAEKNAVRSAGETKKISDEAVELINKGDLNGARALLDEAVAKDQDNFDARMNLCFLAMKSGDIQSGEEHCNGAVFLAVAPPKHTVPSKDRLPSAFYSRGLFYLMTGNRAEACRDLKRAAAEAPAGWPPAAEAREQAGKACAPDK